MIERYNKNYETIERQGLKTEVINKLNRKTKANTFSGYLVTAMKKARDEGNWEIAKLLESLYEKYKEYKKKEGMKYLIKGAEIWQGKDSYEIFKGVEGEFYITEFRRDKELKEVVESEPKKVDTDKINFLIGIIKQLEVGEKFSAKEVWSRIITHYNLNEEGVNYENFNGGGKMRNQYYFKYYLYPARVLEQMKLITISGGKYGGLKRIR